MLELEAFLLHLVLITLIFLRLPEANLGLASFTSKRSFEGSPASLQRLLNLMIALGIGLYFGLALNFDLPAH